LRDSGAPTERRGVGLHNTRERLAVLYGENYRFAIFNARPGLRIDMGLPLERAAAATEAPAPPPPTRLGAHA
jgi:LytS/YehU family sensor histidine kinase